MNWKSDSIASRRRDVEKESLLAMCLPLRAERSAIREKEACFLLGFKSRPISVNDPPREFETFLRSFSVSPTKVQIILPDAVHSQSVVVLPPFPVTSVVSPGVLILRLRISSWPPTTDALSFISVLLALPLNFAHNNKDTAASFMKELPSAGNRVFVSFRRFH